jgi:Mg-chelatase subunit ChlD
MDSTWAKKKKFQYTMGFLFVALFLAGYPVFLILNSTFNKPATCFDNKKNQDERGIDCGGGCARPCVGETKDLTVLSPKVFDVGNGSYDFSATVTNPNPKAYLKKFDYTINIYDKSGTKIFTKEGSDHALAGERFIVFEPNIRISKGIVPERSELIIHTPLEWLQGSVETTTIVTGKKELMHTENNSRLNVELQNSSAIGSYENIYVYAVVSDINGNPVGVSRTFLENLKAGEDKSVFFTWPVSLKEQTAGLCDNRANLKKELLIPSDVMFVFDRSGSMDNNRSKPPQPLTDAKNAAKEYVKTMLSVDRAGLVSFSNEASNPIDQGLTGDIEKLNSAIDAITISLPKNEQNTNLGDGIKKAIEELTANGLKKSKKAIIVLTDGEATRPLDPIRKNYPEEYAALQASDAQKKDILLYTIGLSVNKQNQIFLANDISTTPEKFYEAESSAGLAKIYSAISQAVCEEDIFTYEIFVRVPQE